MISSTPSPDRPERPESIAPFAPKTRARSVEMGSDQLSLAHVELLRTALASQPAIRPEVVERARALAADPAWPTHDIMRRVSEMILQSPDLTEDVS
jgi:hypothetical protein